MNKTNGYFDFHTHILPGVDDGSQSMEETIKMLRIAAKQEISTIIATPHYIAGESNHSVDKLLLIRDQVQAEADKLELKINILLGNELYYSNSILEALKTEKALTLAGTRYVLVEFSVRDSFDKIYRAMGEFVRAGYTPILAHVERYLCLHKREDLVGELVELGCYIQMNCSSLMGGIFQREAALNRKLLNQGLVHLLGSDCHDPSVRIPCMSSLAKQLHRKCNENLINIIFQENPMKVLENKYI